MHYRSDRQGHQMARVFRAALLLALIMGLSWAVSAWAKESAISGDTTTQNVNAFAGELAWSREAPNGVHRLVTYSPKPTLLGPPRPMDVDVRTSDSPFDPDVGVSTRGEPRVVYTRCVGVSGRNCDVYQFDGKRESMVKGAASSRCSEFAPSIWRGIIAFARSGPGRCGGLYLKGRGPALRLDARIPADTDINRNQVAYLHIPKPSKPVIRVFSLSRGGGRSHVIVAGVRAEGERTRVTNPTFKGRFLFFLFEDLRRDDFLVGRSRAQPGSVLEFSDRKLPGSVDSIAVDGRAVFYTNGKGVYQATDPAPHFSARH
jgi:hypothetical protein